MIPRTRLFIILGVVGCALSIVLWDSLAYLAVLAAALGLMMVRSVTNISSMFDVTRNPAAFKVTGGRFVGPLQASQGEPLMLILVMLGGQITFVLRVFKDPDPIVNGPLAWSMLSVTILFGVVFTLVAVAAWRAEPYQLALTPEGIVTRTLWDRRTFPWEALSAGGPRRPRVGEQRILLSVARPELVRRSRFRMPGVGDSVPSQTGTHPWLVADAIRWYAEHPEDRAAIGTEAEHARLLAVLGAETLVQPAPPVPQPPGVVRNAIRVGYTAVAFGLFTAVLDLVLTLAYSEELKAYAVVVGEREIQEFGGDPVDWESSVSFSQAWYAMVLVMMLLLAIASVPALRALRRGNMAGWLATLGLSAAAIVWAAVPCFDIAFATPPPDLTLLFYAVSGLKRLGYIGFGAVTILLLVMPAARGFVKTSALRPA